MLDGIRKFTYINEGNINNKNDKANEYATKLGDFKKVFKEFVNTINNIRAANPISTLMFLDSMAKLGKGDNICEIIDKDSFKDYLGFADLSNLIKSLSDKYSVSLI